MSKPIPVFHNFIGQRRIVGVLRRIIAGAKIKGESCLDIALFGSSGLGKTALAEAIAKEFGTKVHFFFGSEKLTRAIIIAAAKDWEPCDFVFLDEGHRLSPEIQEIFYLIMTDRKISLAGAECDGFSAQVTTENKVAAVTIIVATDQPGRLNSAFKKRFAFEFNLQPYSQKEMVGIVRQRACQLQMLLTSQAAAELAASCRGNPRMAGHRLKGLRHFFAERDPSQFVAGHVERFLKNLEIDSLNRTRMDRGYLKVLAQHGGSKVSVQTLAKALSSDANYIRSDVEPWLLQMGWAGIAPGGRYLTEPGQALVKLDQGGE